jgi:hypothetical protein
MRIICKRKDLETAINKLHEIIKSDFKISLTALKKELQLRINDINTSIVYEIPAEVLEGGTSSVSIDTITLSNRFDNRFDNVIIEENDMNLILSPYIEQEKTQEIIKDEFKSTVEIIKSKELFYKFEEVLTEGKDKTTIYQGYKKAELNEICEYLITTLHNQLTSSSETKCELDDAIQMLLYELLNPQIELKKK